MKELRKKTTARKIVGLLWLLSHHLFLITPTVALTKPISRNNLYDGEQSRGHHFETGKDWVATITQIIERQNKRLSFLEHANMKKNNQTNGEIQSLAPADPVIKDKEINELKHEIAQLQEMAKMFRSGSIGSSGSQHHLMSKRQAAPNAIVCNGATVTLSSSGSCVSKSFLTPDKPDTVPIEPKFIGTPFTSTIVCFVAQKLSYFSDKPKSVIQFEETVLNIGKSFHSDESVFIAPKAGIYEFNFNGHKTGQSAVLKVSLRLNGKDVLNGWSDDMGYHNGYGNHKNRNMISMHSLLKLNKGDRVDLFLKEGTLHDDDVHHQIHFTGKLLFDEDAAAATFNSTQKKIPSPVYFTLQKSASFNTKGAVIPFEVESLNVGGAFDMKMQVFTPPVAGIYEITLKGFKTGQTDSLNISLRQNGKAVANSWIDYVGGHDFHTPYSINSILKAQKGDKISFYLLEGNVYDDSNRYTTYTGKLLMEKPDTQTEFSAVYFTVQKSSPFNIADEVVPFEKEILNVGGAFNMKENTFTAPKGGIYEFNFKGMKNGALTYLVVALRVNGKPVAYAWAEYVNRHDHYTPFFLHSILKLKKGDRIDLFMEDGELLDDLNQYSHFTGKLLFADDVKA